MASDQPKLYGLIGHPVGHTLSPHIMNRAFAEAGIDAVYAAFDVAPDRFPAASRALAAFGIAGVNVTYPFKERILEVADRRSRVVETIGAANSLVISAGKIEAHNTDAEGAARAIETFAGVALVGKRALVLGCGGAGRAAAFGLLEAGAESVAFAVRDPSKANGSLVSLRAAFPDRVGEPIDARGESGRLAQSVEEADIIINATPVGMSDPEISGKENESIIKESWIGAKHCCFDFVYYPRTTRFLDCASRRGALTVDGLALLVCQARGAFQLWTGREFSLEPMYDAVVVEYSRRES
jgi:shikimate dehydrogenase